MSNGSCLRKLSFATTPQNDFVAEILPASARLLKSSVAMFTLASAFLLTASAQAPPSGSFALTCSPKFGFNLKVRTTTLGQTLFLFMTSASETHRAKFRNMRSLASVYSLHVKRCKNLVAILTAAGLAAVIMGAFYWWASAPRRNLDRFLAQILTVNLGSTSLAQWRSQVDQAHINGLNIDCEQENCGISWRGSNDLIHDLRLGPKTAADVSVGFRNGIASAIYLVFVVGKQTQTQGWIDGKDVVVRESSDAASCHQDYLLSVKRRYEVGDQFWATVAMDPCISPDNRSKAFAINTGCLTRIGGCKTVQSMLPKVFSRPG